MGQTLPQNKPDSAKCQYCWALSSGLAPSLTRDRSIRRAETPCLGFPLSLGLFWRTILEAVNSRVWVNIWISLYLVLRHNSHAVSADQLACGGLIGSSQVEKVIRCATRLVFSNHVIILSPADHLAAMGDRLHVVLIFVARLVQSILEVDGDKRSYWLYPTAKTLHLESISQEKR